MAEDPHVIDARIKRAREDVARDVNELEYRLNIPLQLREKRDEWIDTAKEKVGMSPSTKYGNGSADTSDIQAVVNAVREHPVAALGVGYGARVIYNAWKHNHQPDGTATEDLGERASAMADRVGDRVDELADEVKGKVPTDAAEVRQTIRSEPAGAGLAAFALGAIIGWLGPRTRFERTKAHEIRESVTDTVQEKAQEVKTAVEAGVEEGIEEVRKELKGDSDKPDRRREPRRSRPGQGPGPIIGGDQGTGTGGTTGTPDRVRGSR